MGRSAEAALDGDWNFACPDWEQRLREGRSLVPDLPLDQGLADQAVAIFNKLRLPDVPGQPTMAEASGEWARDLVKAAFGSLNRTTRRRLIRKIVAMVPKKNSKTTTGAAVSLTAALMNDRPNAELQMVGPTQEIANVAFDQAWGMIDADDEGYLSKRFQVRDHIKTIEDRLTGSLLKIKTFDMKVTTGAKPIFVLLDEMHLMAMISFAQRVFGQIEGNMLANEESLLVGITTQSDDVPAGLWRQELQYARGVRDGRITDRVRTLPMLYEFPEAIQVAKGKPGEPRAWEDPAIWPWVLPNLGKSINLERLIDDYTAAKDKSEAELRRWASQHLNIEIGLGLHADRWRGADHWEAAVDERVNSLEDLIGLCDVAVVGIDGGGLDDLLGLTVVGRVKGGSRWVSWSRAWVEKGLMTARPEIASRLEDFRVQGDLVIFELTIVQDDDGETFVQDLNEVVDICVRLNEAELLPEEDAIGIDPAGVLARLLVDMLAKARIAEKQMTGVAQGFRLMGAIQAAERKLAERMLVHAAQPLMNWCVGNAKAEQKGNAVMITKETAGKAKIDPLSALFNAVELMSRNPQPKLKPKYQMLVLGGARVA